MKRIWTPLFSIATCVAFLFIFNGCDPAAPGQNNAPANAPDSDLSDRPDDQTAPIAAATNAPVTKPAGSGARNRSDNGQTVPAAARALTPEEERATGEIRKRAAESTEALNQQAKAMQKAADEREAKLRDPKQRMNVLFDEMIRQVRHLIRTGQNSAGLNMLNEMEGLPLTDEQAQLVGALKNEVQAAISNGQSNSRDASK